MSLVVIGRHFVAGVNAGGPGNGSGSRAGASLIVGVSLKADRVGERPVGHVVNEVPGRVVGVITITTSGGQAGVKEVDGAGVVGLAVSLGR